MNPASGIASKNLPSGFPHPRVDLTGAIRDVRLDEMRAVRGRRELFAENDKHVLDGSAGMQSLI